MRLHEVPTVNKESRSVIVECTCTVRLENNIDL